MVKKVDFGMQGDSVEVEDGGVVEVKSGGRIHLRSGAVLNLATGAIIKANGAQGAALTTQLTTITPADAAGTPDYAIAAITSTTPFGFSNAAEAITLLYVVQNLQIRLAEIEARLETLGVVVAN